MEIFSERLRRARWDKDLSVAKLADISGVGECTITAYERGRSGPGLYNATLLADALGVSLDWLAGRTDKKE